MTNSDEYKLAPKGHALLRQMINHVRLMIINHNDPDLN